MKTEIENIRHLITIIEYKENLSNDEEELPDEKNPNLSEEQKRLVKAIYETDLFSMESVIEDLKIMLSK